MSFSAAGWKDSVPLPLVAPGIPVILGVRSRRAGLCPAAWGLNRRSSRHRGAGLRSPGERAGAVVWLELLPRHSLGTRGLGSFPEPWAALLCISRD